MTLRTKSDELAAQHRIDANGMDRPRSRPQRLSEYVGGFVRSRSTAMPRTSTGHAVTVIGMDMGKNTLHMVGLDSSGAIVLREKVSRGRIALRFANLPPCLIGNRSRNGDALRCS